MRSSRPVNIPAVDGLAYRASVWSPRSLRPWKLGNAQTQFRVDRIAAGDDFPVSPYSDVIVQNVFDGNPVGVFFNAPGMSRHRFTGASTVSSTRC